MRYFIITLTLLLHLFLIQSADVAQVTPQAQTQGSEQSTQQLTLDQIKARIRVYVTATNEKNKAAIDMAIAAEIDRKGISGFQLDSETLDNFRRLGAGPMTIESLKTRLQAGPESEDPCGLIDKIVVLVANFKNLDDKESDVAVTEIILDQLREATRKYPDTEIKDLKEAISPQEGREVAIAKGREKKATIVLWGWYKQIRGNVNLTVHFDPVQSIPLDLRANQVARVFTTKEIESFTVQVQLSKEMTYLTLFTMGMARLLADDYDGAIERLSAAIEQGNAPDQLVQSSHLYLARGWAFLQKANFNADSRSSVESGIADLNKSTQLDEKEPTGYLLLGLAYLQIQEPDKTFSAVSRTTDLTTDKNQQALAAYLAAAANLLKGQDEKAKQYAARAIEILDSLPPNEGKFALLSLVYLIRDDVVRAASSLTQAANLSDCGQNKVFYAFLRGAIYVDSGELQKAIEEFDSSIRMRPDFARAYWARGNVYYEKKDFRRAVSEYDAAIKLDSSVPEFYDDRGEARFALDQWEDAVADYKKATVVNPHFALAFYHLGFAYSQRKLFHEAIDSFTRYITLEPEDWDGYQSRQEMYKNTGEFDLAIADANQMLRIKPNEASTFLIRGGIYQQKGDLKHSIEDYSVYIKAKPRNVWGYQMRAGVYEKDNQLDKAIADFQSAITLKPDDASIYIQRGLAYMAAGKQELAIADFKKVLELTKDPNLKKIAEAELEIIRKDREAIETKIKPK